MGILDGIPVREEDFPAFQNVPQFDTSRISLCLGGYVQAAAEPLLDELGHEVMQLARDSVAIQAEPVHNTDTQSPTQTTSREEAVTDDVHERNRIPDPEPELAESQENQAEPVRQDAAGLLGAERAEPMRPDDAGGNAAAELPQDGAGRAADGGQDAARPDAESADARPQDEPAELGTDVQQSEATGGGNDPSDAVRNLTESVPMAESEPSPSAFSLPEFPAELLPSLLKADTTSRASNADILSFFSKTPLLIDRLRYIRESYKVVFTELLLEDDTRVGFYIGCVGGNVLEPSMGVGAFFGHRHSKFDTHNAKLYGVELDSLSGRIAQQLYQKAKIQITGYEKADLPDNFFDLAIGNVPFGQYQVSDRRYDKLHFQIHDYFLANGSHSCEQAA